MKSYWILYADDLALFCRTIEEAQTLLEIVDRTCRRFGLTISFKKTTQIFGNEELAVAESHIAIGMEQIENVR